MELDQKRLTTIQPSVIITSLQGKIMIKLQGLTAREVELLDIIWAIEDKYEVVEWMETLGRRDRLIASTLIQLLAAEIIDAEILDGAELSEAVQIIDYIRSL